MPFSYIDKLWGNNGIVLFIYFIITVLTSQAKVIPYTGGGKGEDICKITIDQFDSFCR